jgi:hypothetical protein
MQCVGLATPGPHFYFILKKIVSISPNRAFDFFFCFKFIFLVILDRLDVMSKMKKTLF